MDDLSALPLRELIALARQRLGSGASSLKTRAEFLSALAGAPGSTSAPAPPASRVSAPSAPVLARPPVVTRDFFVARRA